MELSEIFMNICGCVFATVFIQCIQYMYYLLGGK